ncbi:hypothetical protein [Streptomyces sp. NPDC048527]|uniref:hypothetical protein n=1 Tax=Streptomyces sp. NPDC048527 TaxID=3365568 RepID=UPI0037101670
MPSHLTEVCRAGSARPATPAHSGHPTTPRTDVYQPESPGSGSAFLDVLFSAQSLLLIAIGVLAITMLLAVTWSNRREDRRGKRDTPTVRPPHPPED